MNSPDRVRRGEVWMVDLGIPSGSEAAFRRPAVVVSNNAANQSAANLGRGVVSVVPITTNLRRVFPFQVRLTARDCGLPHDSKAQAEQVRSVAVERLHSRVGRVPPHMMGAIDDALRLHLAL